MVWIEHVDGRGRTTCAGFVAWTRIIADRMERVAIGNLFFLNQSKRSVKIFARHCKSIMLVSLCAPRRELQCEIVTNPHHRKRPIFAFVLKAEDIDVEIYAWREFVYIEDQVINCRHIERLAYASCVN